MAVTDGVSFRNFQNVKFHAKMHCIQQKDNLDRKLDRKM